MSETGSKYDVLKLLLDHGADIANPPHQGSNAAEIAHSEGYVQAARFVETYAAKLQGAQNTPSHQAWSGGPGDRKTSIGNIFSTVSALCGIKSLTTGQMCMVWFYGSIVAGIYMW